MNLFIWCICLCACAHACMHAHDVSASRLMGQFAGLHSLLPPFWLDRLQAVNLDRLRALAASHPLGHLSNPVSVCAAPPDPHGPYTVILQLNYQRMRVTKHYLAEVWSWQAGGVGETERYSHRQLRMGRKVYVQKSVGICLGRTGFIQVFFPCDYLYPHYFPSSTSG